MHFAQSIKPMVKRVILLTAGTALMLGAVGCSGPFQKKGDPGVGLQPRLAGVDTSRGFGDAPDEMLFPKALPDIGEGEYEALGDLLLRKGQYPNAYAHYEKALAQDPGNGRLKYKQGVALLQAGENAEALAHFEAAIALDGGLAPAFEGAGAALFRLQRLAEARKPLSRAVELDGSLWHAHSLLGNLSDWEGDYPQAEVHYRSAIANGPSPGKIFNDWGVSRLLAKDPDGAVLALRKALESGYRAPVVYNNLGLALAGQGNVEDAYHAFLQAGSEATACNNMGYVYFSKGDYRRAVAYFEKAIAASPTFYVKAGENLDRARSRLSP